MTEPVGGASGIAIVGMAGRFPAARSPRELWRMLDESREATRWLTDVDLIAAGEKPNMLSDPDYVRAAMILPDMDKFDAEFFGFTPREAAILDPQHRHFLEACWESLEDSGHIPARFAGAIGVFGGCGMQAYMARNLLTNPELVEQIGMFLLRHTGNDKDFLTTRASYLFDLHGPSVGVQTACSTSLVAVHMACQSLLAGECDMALAGGVSIDLPHGRGYRYAQGEILSSTGHCRAFDDAADGTLFGSGVGVVVLRRIADAIADGDNIYAVIRGSAINNDGAGKSGYLAPSVEGQAQAAAEALAIAEVEPGSIDYIEAHGTGTLVGDPIELAALQEAYGGAAPGRVGIGSIKTNIGHLDTAAGVASLIKVALALTHERIPSSLNFTRPNSRFDFAKSPFSVVDTARSWGRNAKPRRAAVNSLGVGGTNAHVVVEEAPPQPAPTAPRDPQLVCLSAKTPASLAGLREKWAAYLHDPQLKQAAADIAYTTHVGRKAFAYRCALVGKTAGELAAALSDGSSRQRLAGVAPLDPPRVVFMFPGGGAQYPGACSELYHHEPSFRAAVDACFSALPDSAPADLRALMFERGSDDKAAANALQAPLHSVLAVFIIEYALGVLMQARGVKPAAMIGHSAGEYAAAALAGVMTLKDALATAALRGEIFRSVPLGGMLSIKASEASVRALLPDGLDVAVINGPNLVVVSGPHGLLDAFASSLADAQIESSKVRINVAAHSRMLTPFLPQLRAHMHKLALHEPSVPLISNLAGRWARPGEAVDPEYWVRHLREPVRFGDGLAAVLDQPGTILLEIGPGQALCALARLAEAAHEPHAVIASTRVASDKDDDTAILTAALGALWAHGVEIDFEAVRGPGPRRRVSAPTYAFEKHRHWIEPGSPTSAADEVGVTIERRQSMDDWLLTPQWIDRAAAPADAIKGDVWLAFIDSSAQSKAIVDLLRRRGGVVTLVEPGDTLEEVARDHFTLSPSNPADYGNLLATLEQRGAMPSKILHLWSLNAPRLNVRNCDVALPLGFDSAFLLSQALQINDWAGHVCIVTAGAMGVEGQAPSHPERAALQGVCRVLPKETAGLVAQMIDIDLAMSGEATAARLLAEIDGSASEPVVAYRAARRLVLSEMPAVRTAGKPVQRLRDRGVYLITGGLGGIGLELAEYLARSVKARLVLTSRTALPPREDWAEIARKDDASERAARIRRLLAMEGMGAEIMVMAADVADFHGMAEVIDAARARFGAVNGVFHAAGFVDDALIAVKTLESARKVLAPKIAGAFVLNELLPPGSLDLFAVFTSTSVLIGAPGQVDYVAANAVLESVAAARSDGLAIAWGVWGDVGMAASLTNSPTEIAGRQTGHPLLGERTEHGDAIVYTARYRPSALWALSEHVVSGAPILPGAAYIEIAAAVAADQDWRDGLSLRTANFLSPLAFAGDAPREVRTTLMRDSNGDGRIEVESRRTPGEQWVLHFQANLGRLVRPKVAKASPPASALQPVAKDRLTLAERGVTFGPRWLCLQSAAGFAHDAEGCVLLDDAYVDDLATWRVHPALLDVAWSVGLFLVDSHGDGVFAPMSIGTMRLRGPLPRRFRAFARLIEHKPGEHATFDVELSDMKGRVLATFTNFSLKWIDNHTMTSAGSARAAIDPETPQFARMLSAGIRAEDAPEIFARVLSTTHSAIVASSIPLAQLRTAAALGSRKATPTIKRGPAPVDKQGSGNDVEAQIARMCADILGVETIQPEEEFLSFGGGSLAGVRLFAKIRKELQVDLSLSALFQAPTVRALAALVSAELGVKTSGAEQSEAKGLVPSASQWTPLVPISRGMAHRRPLFCVHGGGGNVVVFKPLVDLLDPEIPCYGLEARGVNGRQPFQDTIEEMAETYLAAIRSVDPVGPYRLAGYSGGGVVAYEMAQRIIADGGEVELLAMFDTMAPQVVTKTRSLAGKIRTMTAMHPGYLLNWPNMALRRMLDQRRIRAVESGKNPNAASPLEVVGARAFEAFMRAQEKYHPQPHAGDILLISASMATAAYTNAGATLGWSKYIGGRIDRRCVEARHETMFMPPAVDQVVAILNERLHELDSNAHAARREEADVGA